MPNIGAWDPMNLSVQVWEPWLRHCLLIGKFRGNQILTPGLTMSNAKRSVSAYLPRLYPGIRPHVDLRCKIIINLKSAHEITLEIIELADLLLWLG